MKSKLVQCPQCGKSVEYHPDNLSRPFCSPRCKLLDLGAWAEERYAIAAPSSDTDTAGLQADAVASDSPPGVTAARAE